MNELALFAGIGGSSLAGKILGWRTVCAVELDPYCREVLLRRQRDGVLDLFPIWDDVRTIDACAWRGAVDLVTAGFPCQPWSCAGRRKGESDERNLWPETLRVLRDVRPRFALLENVPGLLASDYFGTILRDLAEAGFDARWEVVSAAGVGAPHLRKRLWILAYTDQLAKSKTRQELSRRNGSTPRGEALADAFAGDNGTQRTAAERGGWWESEPDVGRVAHGIPDRVGKLRALGNAWVPGVAIEAWRRLTQ